MSDSRIEDVKENILRYYSMLNQEGKNVTGIDYYSQIIFDNENSKINFGLSDLYSISFSQIEDGKERNMIAIYSEGEEVAIIDENNKIKFNSDFMQKMQDMNNAIYELLKSIEDAEYELPEIENDKSNKYPDINEESDLNLHVGAKELSELDNKRKEDIKGKEDEKTKENSEDQNLEIIAKSSGIDKREINSCSEINPQEKITDEKSFEDIAGIKGKYSKIFVVNSNSKDNSRFSFWGLNGDGKVEQIEGLEERQGVNTGKTICAINRDGSKVQKEQTTALFTMSNNREGFSVTIGQYGIVETTYVRKSPGENRFIGSKINSSTQRPTTREVKEFMNSGRTTDTELDAVIDRTEEELDDTDITHMRNIDDIEGNDVAIDIDQEIIVKGESTSLRQEAQRLELTPDEYRQEIENITADTTEDKIMLIRSKYEKKQAEERDDEEDGKDRGERLTPEEEALKRRGY